MLENYLALATAELPLARKKGLNHNVTTATAAIMKQLAAQMSAR